MSHCCGGRDVGGATRQARRLIRCMIHVIVVAVHGYDFGISGKPLWIIPAQSMSQSPGKSYAACIATLLGTMPTQLERDRDALRNGRLSSCDRMEDGHLAQWCTSRG